MHSIPLYHGTAHPAYAVHRSLTFLWYGTPLYHGTAHPAYAIALTHFRVRHTT